MFFTIMGVCHCILVLCFGVILASCQDSSRNFDHVEWSNAYDYVIVGGGTAGSVLAARLSENPKHKVLVIEAGFDDLLVPFIEVPFMTRRLVDPLVGVKWDFQTEPQPFACRSYLENRAFWPQGKVLGGTSSINWMEYVRGSKADFDAWAALGNKGWSFEDVLPYFKKSERNLNTTLNPDYHGFTGPWVIEDTSASPEVIERFLSAGVELEYNVIEPNDPSHTGFSRFQLDSFLGRRMNLAKSFLKPNMGRPNLKVITLAYVTKILISHNKARGVQYLDLQTQQHFSIKATKEVIVSAGALQSPKLLMLSGIGPREHLEELGIPVLSDLPVGKALEDHYLIALPYTFNKTISPTPQQLASFGALSQYVFTGTGIWTVPGALAQALVRPKNSAFGGTFETLQLQIFHHLMGATGPVELVELLRLKPEIAEAISENNVGKAGVSFIIALMHPLARGTVSLRSLNPLEKPKIVLNYLEHDEDLEELISGVRIIQELLETTPFKEIGPKLALDPHPRCAQFEADSHDYWECYAREMTTTGYHYIGTCRMGKSSSDAVVNRKLKVHGIDKLRVVDASVMPMAITGNTMATTVMIAEKAADMIK